MKIKSTIRHVHDVKPGETVSYGGYWAAQQLTRIATIAIGYGDGYLRGEYNKGFVFIRGQLCPILGRVCMDATKLVKLLMLSMVNSTSASRWKALPTSITRFHTN